MIKINTMPGNLLPGTVRSRMAITTILDTTQERHESACCPPPAVYQSSGSSLGGFGGSDYLEGNLNTRSYQQETSTGTTTHLNPDTWRVGQEGLKRRPPGPRCMADVKSEYQQGRRAKRPKRTAPQRPATPVWLSLKSRDNSAQPSISVALEPLPPQRKRNQERQDRNVVPSQDMNGQEFILMQLTNPRSLSWKDIAARFKEKTGKAQSIPALQMRVKRLQDRLRTRTLPV